MSKNAGPKSNAVIAFIPVAENIGTSLGDLFKNIDSCDLPLGLVKQFFPNAFMKILEEDYPLDSESLVKSNVIDVIEDYFYATKAS